MGFNGNMIKVIIGIYFKGGEILLRILVFYDSWCPICIKVRNNIEKLDWLHLIKLQSIRDNLNEYEISVAKEELEKKMYCLNLDSGRLTSGIDAIASIVGRLPLLMVLWPLLKLSSIIGVGHWVYDRIARSRTIIPVNNCSNDVCNLDLRKK